MDVMKSGRTVVIVSTIAITMLGTYHIVPLVILSPEQQMAHIKIEADVKRFEIEKRYEEHKEMRGKYIEMARLIVKQWDGRLPQIVIGSAINTVDCQEECE
jgi:hypothetical protein